MCYHRAPLEIEEEVLNCDYHPVFLFLLPLTTLYLMTYARGRGFNPRYRQIHSGSDDHLK